MKKMRFPHLRSLAAASIAAASLTSAPAALVHRYEFNGDTNDSVGSSHGTLVGTASVTGGALVTNGGNGAVNGTFSGTGPRMTVDASAVAGITGSFTIETWFTCSTGWPKFDTIYAFSDGTTGNYLLGAPVRGYSPWPSGVAIKGAGGVGDGNFDQAVTGIYLDNNALHQTVLTYDGTTFTYYIDGVLASGFGPATAVDPGFNLSTLTSIGVNGGSPWGDPSLTGSTSDFRIYNHALTETQVASVYTLGADASSASVAGAVPEPATSLLGAFGILCLLRRRQR